MAALSSPSIAGADERTLIPIDDSGAYCTIYAKLTHKCTSSRNGGVFTGRCTGTIEAGTDRATYVLHASSRPARGKPPMRSTRADLIECSAGPSNVEWRGCEMTSNVANNTSYYKAVCGSCDRSGTNCRVHSGSLHIVRSIRKSRRVATER